MAQDEFLKALARTAAAARRAHGSSSGAPARAVPPLAVLALTPGAFVGEWPGPHMVHSHTVHLPLGALLSPCTMCGTGEWLAEADAALALFLPGQETGVAAADVLTGAVSPSAKLPVTVPVNEKDVTPADPPHSALPALPHAVHLSPRCPADHVHRVCPHR